MNKITKLKYILYNGIKYILPEKDMPVENTVKIVRMQVAGNLYEFPAPIYLEQPPEGKSFYDMLLKKLADFDIFEDGSETLCINN